MIIAVDTRFLVKKESNSYSNFIYETFTRITSLHKEHTFIFVNDKPFDTSFIFSENVLQIVKGQQIRRYASFLIWYNIKIPAVLKKYKAEIFISFESCSLITKIPQYLIISDLSFLYYPSKSYSFFYKKFIARSLKKSSIVATVSEFLKRTIVKHYEVNVEKIKVVYGSSGEKFLPINIEQRESIKEEYANANEYFIYKGALLEKNNLLNLLKAFSAFKKRQKSSMQLLIVTDNSIEYKLLLETLRLFKFKDEVKLLIDLPASEIVKITSAAYAFVYPSFFEGFPEEVIEAMKCNVPVITSSASAMPEVCGDAVLYFDPNNFKEIAVQMMKLFKDEGLRKKLIEKGKVQAAKFTWDRTSQLLWELIEKDIENRNLYT